MGEATATTNITRMTAAPMAPRGRARQNSRAAASQRASAPGGAASMTSGTGTRATAMTSPVPDAGVDPCVPHVHEEVHHDEAAGHEHDQRLDERVVPVGDGLHEEQPEPVEIEDL